MLLARHLRIDLADPLWPDRDRVFHTADAPSPAAGATSLPGPPGLMTAAAVGAALAERRLAARFGRSLVDHRTWLLAGPAELAAGAAQEAAAIAGAVSLGRLAIVANLPSPNAALLARFAAVGWVVRHVAAGDVSAIDAAVAAAQRAHRPTLIACPGPARTPPEPDSEPQTRDRGASARRAWLKRLRRHTSAEAFERALAGRPGPGWLEALAATAAEPPLSPAEAAANALSRLAPAWPELCGLQPDQAASAGRAVAWCHGTQAEAGGLLGMALHGGVVPVGHFSGNAVDAALPALRAAAALGLRTLHLVHEDTPPPADIVAAWRALPGVRLFRPADAVEALECLEMVLRHGHAPSILLLSGQVVAPLVPPRPRASAQGGYLVQPAPYRDVTLVASGADLALARAARTRLAASAVNASVVSLPCRHLFAAQTAEYRREVLGTAPRIVLEAGGSFGWGRLLGDTGLFIDTRVAADADAVAHAVLRHLRREAAILDKPAKFLESRHEFD